MMHPDPVTDLLSSGLHSDQGPVADGAGVDESLVPDRDIVTEHRGRGLLTVDHRIVLDIGAGTDPHRTDIAAQDHAVEDRGVLPDCHVPDDHSTGGDPGGAVYSWHPPVEREDQGTGDRGRQSSAHVTTLTDGRGMTGVESHALSRR